MLRFKPDSWFEGLLRPVLMPDPSAGLYYEDAAPDWRFLFVLLLVAVGALSGRLRRLATTEHKRMLLALLALFYTWTFAIGNGRYFIAGLLLVGPLVVVAWQWLPGTRALRWSLLGVMFAMQAISLHAMYRPGAWTLVEWRNGPAVDLSASPWRERPVGIVTVTAISYSILAPKFHPQSRWTNLVGQVDITRQRVEWPQAQALLDSPLPLMLLAPAVHRESDRIGQPSVKAWSAIRKILRPHGLAPSGAACEILYSRMLPRAAREDARPIDDGAFWLCPLVRMQTPAFEPEQDDPRAAVFEQAERLCPRFFPPGTAPSKRYDGYWQRHYIASDTRLYVDDSGNVVFWYFRSFTPTVMGQADAILQGRVRFDCSKLPGRYRAPWDSD